MHDHFTEQRCPVVLFIMLYKTILTLESVDKILKCDHSTFLWCCGLIWFTVLKTGSLDTCKLCNAIPHGKSAIMYLPMLSPIAGRGYRQTQGTFTFSCKPE